MRCKIATLDQMGAAIGSLTKYAELSTPMNEETKYYLRVVLNELITNSLKYGGGGSLNEVHVEVSVKGESLVVTVDDGGRGIDARMLGKCSDVYSEGGRGLAIVKGLCNSVHLNPAGNRVTASLSIS